METKTKNELSFNVLSAISKVYRSSKKSGLKKELFRKIDDKLELLTAYFHVSKEQAFLLANIYALACSNRRIELSDLGHHFDCDQIDLLRYQEDLDILNKKGFLLKKRDVNMMSGSKYYNYEFDESVSHSIVKNLPVPELKPLVCKDIFEVLEKIYDLGRNRMNHCIDTSVLLDETKTITDINMHIPFLQKVRNLGFPPIDNYLFLYLCWKTIAGNENTDLSNALEDIFVLSHEKARYAQKIMSGDNTLIKQKFIELVEHTFFDYTDIKLGSKSIELLKSENITLFSKNIRRENIMEPDKIGIKELFFGEKENSQLGMISNMLQDENLNALKERLVKKSMPSGIAILLYGAPGTGKTESVFQLARRTGREIMHVDISQSKSMWFGESEKKIKQIFSDYNDFVEQSERCPILLFNEADAIFSKRKDSNFSNVAQTENAMQNIILEEMEKLKGIMIATTNLTNNLDSAFERRFLYKVEFFMPDSKVRQKIWQYKVSYLAGKDCCMLADQFDFSGGQIDNITRKCEMFELLNGNFPDIDKIMEFCREELISKAYCNTIGFKIN
ncbi:MAG TPA: AAA family ATPase [Bacteroidales bacterium]|nr:AAA family ATPase [Bacteroidales bacterium]